MAPGLHVESQRRRWQGVDATADWPEEMLSYCGYIDVSISWFVDEEGRDVDRPEQWQCLDCGGLNFVGVHRPTWP